MEKGPPMVEDLDPERERRLFAILKGIQGGMSVNVLAAQLGISRERYYELQRQVVRAAREALKPQKPGRKAPSKDPEKEKLQQENLRLKRELTRTKSQLDVAKRQAKGPEEDPEPPRPRPRKGHTGNRFPAEEKAEALENLQQEQDLGTPKADFCKATGYCSKSLARWLPRLTAGALADRPSVALSQPNRIPESRRREIVHLALVKRGTYGAEAIRMALDAPESESSIRRILRASPWDPKEVLWTKVGICHALDFMHLGPWGTWGRLLTLQEEHSRFKPLWELRRTWTSQAVARYLEQAWEILGVPLILKHDQGPEFISGYFQGFLAERRVLSLPSPPYRGSYNGKEERLNGFIRAWTRPLERARQGGLLHQVLAEAYQDLNFQRPMKVLGARTPYDVFSTAPRVSKQEWQALLRAAERFTTMHECDLALKERGLLLSRKAAMVAAQEVGLLVIRPREKCQPISA